MSDTHTTTGGVGFTGLLQVAFIVLKLTGTIKWSWFWVLAPTWMSMALVVVLLVIVGFAALLIHLVRR